MHFVFFIVGFLQQHRYAVSEFNLGIAKLRTAFLAYHLTRFGQFANDGFVFHVVHISRKVSRTSVSHSVKQSILGGINHAILLGIKVNDNQIGIGCRHQLAKQLVNCFQWDIWHHLFHRFIIVFDVWYRFVIEEVFFVILGKFRVVTLFAVAKHAVERAQSRRFRAVVFGLGKTKTSSSKRLDVRRFQGIGAQFGGLRRHSNRESLLSFCVDIFFIASASAHKGAFGLQRSLGQAFVKQANTHIFHILVYQITHIPFERVGCRVVFHHHLHDRGRLLLVFINDNDGFVVVGNRLAKHRSGVCGVLHRTEKLFNFGFDMVNIHVAHHDNTLISGVIPFLVVVAQLLIFKVIHHAHQSNGETSAIFRTRIELREVAFEHSAAGASAQTPLFVYHSAFFINLGWVECERIGPVA